MGSPISLVIANIYMEYCEELALGPQCSIPIPWWNRYADVVICIMKKDQVDILLNHNNNMGDHIRFTMECPDNEGSFPSWTQGALQTNPNNTIHTAVYRKSTHTER